MSSTSSAPALDSNLIEAVHRLTRKLASAEDNDEQVRSALEIALEASGAAGGSVLLHDPQRQELRFVCALGSKAGEPPAPVADLVSRTIKQDEGIAGQVFKTGVAQYVNDAKSDSRHSGRVDESIQFRTESLATVPICFAGGQSLGVMQLVNRPGGFREEDLAALKALASIVALSIGLRLSRG